jgi:hypothetical protein
MSRLEHVRDAIDRVTAGPVTRADRPLWAATRTRDDVGELTAQWLEGRIASQPGCSGTVDVDEDDAPGLTDTLVLLNRSGFVTDQSQAGCDTTNEYGHWRQHAAVSGYASRATCVWLRDRLTGTRYRLTASVLDWRGRPERLVGRPVTVTWRDNRPWTTFGRPLRRRDIRFLYGDCGREAIDALCAAVQITIYDPRPARNDLWSFLRGEFQLNRNLTEGQPS